MKIQFQLTGSTPLLMHYYNIDGADILSEWRKSPDNRNISKPGDDRSPAWTWMTYCYQDGENLAIPAENMMTCLRQAGARKILAKQKTFKELTQTGILIPTEFLEFTVHGKKIGWPQVAALKGKTFKEQADAVTGLGFVLWSKAVVIGKAKHIRVRPRFNDWEVNGVADIIDPALTMDVLKEIFDLAGKVGLGDWRPGCKTPGPFGMFDAKIRKA